LKLLHLPLYPSVCTHETAQKWLKEFLLNFMFKGLTKIHIPILVKIGQDLWTLHENLDAFLCSKRIGLGITHKWNFCAKNLSQAISWPFMMVKGRILATTQELLCYAYISCLGYI
jgi:hypothetical protein